MGIGIGRLLDVRSYSELRNAIVQQLDGFCMLEPRRVEAAGRWNFKDGGYFEIFNGELDRIEYAALKCRVLMVRLIESLKIVEANLENTREREKKKSDTDSKQKIKDLDSYLKKVKQMKVKLADGTIKSVSDEGKILGYIKS